MRTFEDLKMLQALPLDAKVLKTKQRIREWYRAFDGKVYVSFSGGKDSTVLLHIVRELYPEVEAVFVDTGLEFPEIKAFVKTFDNVTWVRPKMAFREVISQYGYPLISKEVSKKVYDARRCPTGYAAARFDPESEYNKKYKKYSLSRWAWLRGCMFCAFGAHREKTPNRFQRMKVTHPKIYDYCMRPWDQGGLGMAEILEKIGVETDYDQYTMEVRK